MTIESSQRDFCVLCGFIFVVMLIWLIYLIGEVTTKKASGYPKKQLTRHPCQYGCDKCSEHPFGC